MKEDIFFYLYAEAQPGRLNDEVILKNGLNLSDYYKVDRITFPAASLKGVVPSSIKIFPCHDLQGIYKYF